MKDPLCSATMPGAPAASLDVGSKAATHIGEALKEMDIWPDPKQLERVNQCLKKARRMAIAKANSTLRGVLQAEDVVQIEAAMLKTLTLCRLYQDSIFERAHSPRVRVMVKDLADLQELLTTLGEGPIAPEDEERVRALIKTFRHETRNWMALPPSREGVKTLPAKEGKSPEERFDRRMQLWKVTEAAKLAPPPRGVGEVNSSTPWLQPLPFRLTKMGAPTPSEPIDGAGGPPWTFKVPELTEFTAYALEALLIEAKGPDRGGSATYIQRRYGAHPKESFALSCVLIYEGVVGEGSAKQSNADKRSQGKRTNFEVFCTLVCQLALGEEDNPDWAIGLDPFRRAIANSRAWRALYQAAGCKEAPGFDALPASDQERALKSLPDRVRLRLTPEAPPWI